MSDENTTDFNVKGLDQLLKALNKKAPTCRVGILGSRVTRKSVPNQMNFATNAEIGTTHEFGSIAKGIPERSFLRVPIGNLLTQRMTELGFLDDDVMKEVIDAGTVIPWVNKIAIIAEGIVNDAFASSGFGLWPPWKDSSYTNNTGMLLIDTQQLRDSISSEVKP